MESFARSKGHVKKGENVAVIIWPGPCRVVNLQGGNRQGGHNGITQSTVDAVQLDQPRETTDVKLHVILRLGHRLTLRGRQLRKSLLAAIRTGQLPLDLIRDPGHAARLPDPLERLGHVGLIEINEYWLQVVQERDDLGDIGLQHGRRGIQQEQIHHIAMKQLPVTDRYGVGVLRCVHKSVPFVHADPEELVDRDIPPHLQRMRQRVGHAERMSASTFRRETRGELLLGERVAQKPSGRRFARADNPFHEDEFGVAHGMLLRASPALDTAQLLGLDIDTAPRAERRR